VGKRKSAGGVNPFRELAESIHKSSDVRCSHVRGIQEQEFRFSILVSSHLNLNLSCLTHCFRCWDEFIVRENCDLLLVPILIEDTIELELI
jgi:hypothetical protein